MISTLNVWKKNTRKNLKQIKTLKSQRNLEKNLEETSRETSRKLSVETGDDFTSPKQKKRRSSSENSHTCERKINKN